MDKIKNERYAHCLASQHDPTADSKTHVGLEN